MIHIHWPPARQADAPHWEVVMSKLLVRFLRDEDGSEVVEYALMLGMIVLACMLIIGSLGIKIVARWQDIYDLL
jgi:Flp pilus assembly pilin Flp